MTWADDWTHLCTVAEQRIDPLEALGIVPDRPLPYWGWREIPDQYGRRSEDDDGETPLAAGSAAGRSAAAAPVLGHAFAVILATADRDLRTLVDDLGSDAAVADVWSGPR